MEYQYTDTQVSYLHFDQYKYLKIADLMRTRSSDDIDKSYWSMTKRHEASPWEVLSWRFEPRVRSFFSNIFVECVNFYIILSYIILLLGLLNIINPWINNHLDWLPYHSLQNKVKPYLRSQKNSGLNENNSKLWAKNTNPFSTNI